MDEHALLELARQQYGLATTAQIEALGGSRKLTSRRVTRGLWSQARRGVIVVGGVPPSWDQQLMAACLAGGPHTVASHRTAARLWGMVRRSGRIEVLVGHGRRVRLNGIQAHQSILLPHLDLTTVRGIPATTVARTIADLSAAQDIEVIAQWIDAAMRENGLDLLELRSCVARLTGPGRGQFELLRAVLAQRLPGYDPGDSDLEIRALRALTDAGLPAPTQQHAVELPAGRRAYIDLAYVDDLIAIELDGWDFHGRRSAFDRDRARANELTLLGWRVYRFTSSMSDAVLVSTIARALDRPKAA